MNHAPDLELMFWLMFFLALAFLVASFLAAEIEGRRAERLEALERKWENEE